MHGDPTYALGSPYSRMDKRVLNLVYADVPMVITVFVAGTDASVGANSEVISVWYMKPDDMDLLIQTNNLSYLERVQHVPALTAAMKRERMMSHRASR